MELQILEINWTTINYRFGFNRTKKLTLTSKEELKNRKLGYDKVIMQAGGIGYGKLDRLKETTRR
jgi:phosphoribosylformylglycinamidine synthase